MTPLAHMFMADSVLPVGRRRFVLEKDTNPIHASKLFGLLDDLHFFDAAAVWEAAFTLAGASTNKHMIAVAERSFLAAPRMWIELGNPWGNGRTALLLEQSGEDADVVLIIHRGDGVVVEPMMTLPLLNSSNVGQYQLHHKAFGGLGLARAIYTLLAMINTPRVIGRRIHQPHAGLQRKVAASHSMPGKYPLQAWHELVLEVKPPRDESDRGPQQTILTGGKALHFVRAYLRISGGSLQLVSSHWKGDPALGLKQTRYRVIPPKSRAA